MKSLFETILKVPKFLWRVFLFPFIQKKTLTTKWSTKGPLHLIVSIIQSSANYLYSFLTEFDYTLKLPSASGWGIKENNKDCQNL